MDLCETAEMKRGERVDMRWWEEAGLDLVGARKMVELTVEADKEGLE